MFKKFMAGFVAVMLLAVVCIAGGCGSSSSNSSRITLPVDDSTEVSAADIETLKENGVDLVPYSEQNIKDERKILLCDVEDVEGALEAALKEMFAADGEATVALYEPSIAAIASLDAILGVDDTVELTQEDLDEKSADIRLYCVCRDDKGNLHSYAQVQHGLDWKCELTNESPYRQEDIEAGYVWVEYNEKNSPDTPYDVVTYKCEPVTMTCSDDKTGETHTDTYYRISEDLIGRVPESAITIGLASMDVDINGTRRTVLSVQKKNKVYNLQRSGIELPASMDTQIDVGDIPVTDEEKKAAGELTDEELVASADETDIVNFVKWLLEDKVELAEGEANSNNKSAQVSTASQANSDSNKEAVELFAATTVLSKTVDFSYAKAPGLSMSNTAAIAAVHLFEGTDTNGGHDYYYVKQQCVLTNAISYRNHWKEWGTLRPIKLLEVFYGDSKTGKYIGGAECDEFYIAKYAVTARLYNSDGKEFVLGAKCPSAKPEASNKETTTTVLNEWNIGGAINVGGSKSSNGPSTKDDSTSTEEGQQSNALGGKIGIALNGGFKSSQSVSYKTDDIECKLYNQGANLEWQYTTTKLPERQSLLWKISYPADLSTSSYQPAQYFVWEVPTNQRPNYSNYQNRIIAVVGGSYSGWSGMSSLERKEFLVIPQVQKITLPKPALFCLDTSTINFDPTEKQQKHIVVYSQGDWNFELLADKETEKVPDWLGVSKIDDTQLSIWINSLNTTKNIRTAKIKAWRIVNEPTHKDEADERTITVTQTPVLQ